MRRFIITIACLFVAGLTQAQQDALYSQFQFNKLALNPGYAGSRMTTSFTALYRHQWVGIEGAPRTFNFNVHSPLSNKKLALGLQLSADRLGVTNTTSLFADYAYRIPAGDGHLSVGVQGGVQHYNIGLAEGVNFDPNDPGTAFNYNKWLPNAGIGFYYHTVNFFAGASIPWLIENKLYSNTSASAKGTQSRHYFLMAGYVFDLGESGNVKFRPSMLLKYVQNSPMQLDFNGSFLFVDALWLGVAYRTNASLDFNVEYNLSDQLRIGYAYDFVLGELGAQTSGTHEILIGMDLDFKHEQIVTPRKVVPKYF